MHDRRGDQSRRAAWTESHTGLRQQDRRLRRLPFWFVNKDGFWKRQEREAAAKAAKEEKVVEA